MDEGHRRGLQDHDNIVMVDDISIVSFSLGRASDATGVIGQRWWHYFWGNTLLFRNFLHTEILCRSILFYRRCWQRHLTTLVALFFGYYYDVFRVSSPSNSLNINLSCCLDDSSHYLFLPDEADL
jgi:hypothetical protein